MFPLCLTCANDQCKSCQHSDEQRCLLSTWVCDEIYEAIECGCKFYCYRYISQQSFEKGHPCPCGCRGLCGMSMEVDRPMGAMLIKRKSCLISLLGSTGQQLDIKVAVEDHQLQQKTQPKGLPKWSYWGYCTKWQLISGSRVGDGQTRQSVSDVSKHSDCCSNHRDGGNRLIGRKCIGPSSDQFGNDIEGSPGDQHQPWGMKMRCKCE
uniref:Uncharacterized protein n=1 Tax=Romanomermis culicivorax TaxID=13658 RepID=A0A915K7J6_ROMCU